MHFELISIMSTLATDNPVELHDWVQMIRAEYLEMPGLALTRRQAQRLWGLAPEVCDAALDSMVAAHFLKRMRGDAFVRADTSHQT